MAVSSRVVGLLVTLLIASPATCAQTLGQFEGDVIAKFLSDGRNMQLERPFGYVDPSGKHWDVPTGATIDGASIPQVLWIAYPPFTGKYRVATVIHDYYCETRSESWKATHAVFYDALRTAGVDEIVAKTMWAAVYHFGPRWGPGYRSGSRGPGAEAGMTKEEELVYLGELREWIAAHNPSLDEIASRTTGTPRK